ncbi:MAG: dihydroorotase [Firmicutes bacterium]|nr:dihydroorotase [Bacillota bacterium]
MRLLIKGGTVIDPANKINQAADVLVEDGKIKAVLPGGAGAPADVEVLDASGRLVVPGLIDLHVHLREPGFERKEDIASGTRAAAMGGFTSVACMPNTNPVADTRSVIEYIRTRALKTGVINVFPIGAITRSSEGRELVEMGDLRDGGAVAFSDDGRPVSSAQMMRLAMEYSKIVNLPIISHCEDLTLSEDGLINEGYWSMLLGLRGIPAAAEEVMVARDLILAEMTGCRLHLAHISTEGSVRLIEAAKGRGLAVTAEVTPHHLTLTDAVNANYSTNNKVNPPLRSEEDRLSLIRALRDGVIDIIATDHAPHTREEKDCEYDLAFFGITGLETALPLVWTELVEKQALTPEQLIAAMTVKPAGVIGIDRGNLTVGADADITIIDPGLELTVNAEEFVSKGRNTPFGGMKLRGWPVATLVGGRLVMRERKLLA